MHDHGLSRLQEYRLKLLSTCDLEGARAVAHCIAILRTSESHLRRDDMKEKMCPYALCPAGNDPLVPNTRA